MLAEIWFDVLKAKKISHFDAHMGVIMGTGRRAETHHEQSIGKLRTENNFLLQQQVDGR